MEFNAKVRTCFWFAKGGHEAANFYVSVVPESTIEAVYENGQPDDPMIVEFTLGGAPMMILTGGSQFDHTPAASISVLTKDQGETDRLWSALLADGGKEGMCGWLQDRYGVSWQIVPEALPRLLGDDDADAAKRVFEAMMTMKKINIAAIEAAAE